MNNYRLRFCIGITAGSLLVGIMWN